MQNTLGLPAEIVEKLYLFGVDDILHYTKRDGKIDTMNLIEDITDGLNDEKSMEDIEEDKKKKGLDLIINIQKQHEQERAEEREQERAEEREQERVEEREQEREQERAEERESQRFKEEKEEAVSTYFVLTGKPFSPQREDFVQFYSRSRRQWISKIVTRALPETNCVFLDGIGGSISLERIRPDITSITKVKDEKKQREEEHKFQTFIPHIKDFVEYYSLTLQEWIECSVTQKRKDGDQYYFDISRGLCGIKNDVSLDRIRPVSQTSVLYQLQKHYSADGAS